MRRQYPAFLLVGVVVLLGLSLACERRGEREENERARVDVRPASEAAIRAASAEWSKAAGARDLEKGVSFYADSGSMLPPNAPIATGKEAIRKAWSQMMAAPGFGLSWATTKVEVAKSGDLGYEMGTFELTMNDKKGKPATTKGKFVVVWQKQADGAWKAVADIFNAGQ